MKSLTLTCILLGASLLNSSAQTPKAKSAPGDGPAAKATKKKAAPAIVADDPSLPRVLLIGDSISIGYDTAVRELLQGKANVHRIPENGGPTTNGQAKLTKWLGTGKWDVIHFNWGLHDLKFMEDGRHQVPLENYEKNLRELTAQLKKTGARLVWCHTTPVPEARVNPPRKDSDVVAYNAVARRIMEEHQIAINDLYSHALPKLAEIQQPANVHFSKDGSAFLARRVAAALEEAVRRKP